MNMQKINGISYILHNDYQLDNCAIAPTGWAMFAYATLENSDENVILRVIPTKEEAEQIDAGDAELDFINYDRAPEVIS